MKPFTFNKIIILLSLSIWGVHASAQLPHNEWAKQFGPAGFILGEPKSLLADPTGNVYVAGVFNGTNDFDPGPNVYNLTSSAGSDIFIMKLDVSGNLVWVKQIGASTGDDVASSIAFDAAGNLFVTGNFVGTVDFDPGAGDYPLTAPGYFPDAFILKLNQDGDFIWVKQIGGDNSDASRAITIDRTDNIYITGVFANTADFDPGPGTAYLTSMAYGDKFILKLDPRGNFVWVKQVGGPLGYENPTSLKTDADGNIISIGNFSGTCDFNPDPMAVYNLSSNSGQVGYIVKLDSSGNFLWADAFKGAYSYVFPRSVTIDSSGGIYTVGSFQGTADFDPGLVTYNFHSSQETGFVSKLDAAGSFVWARTLTDRSYCIAMDTHAAIYIGGQAIDGHSITKLNNMSDSIWRVHFGSSYNACNTIFVDGKENIYTAGYFNGSTDFDPGPGTYILTPVLETEIYVHKLNQANVLPVSFISFKGVAIKEGNQLSWVMPGETDARYFEVEKSTNGADFSFLTRLNSLTTGIRSGYNYLDISPVNKVNYYRVRQINKTNEFVLSDIVKVISTNQEIIKIVVSPNPSVNTISITSNHELKNATIRVFDAHGRSLFRKINFSGSILPLNITNFRSGTYMIEVSDAGINYITKFVKK